MSLAAKALWIIERNSDQPISLIDLARACGVSRSHLAHAFGSATGVPAMKYLRGRRLSSAAQALAKGAPDILSIALDAGYNSHEAFTRAFRDQFEMTPESLRERGSVAGLPLTNPIEISAGAAMPTLHPRFEQQGRIQVVGLSATISFEDTTSIPAQWQRFMLRCEEVQHQSRDIPVGLSQAPDAEGLFRYLCGVEVASLEDIPPGLEAAVVAPGRYAVFEHNGHVSSLYETYATIWNEALPEAGCTVADAAVIERHNAGFDPATGDGGLTLWIPLSVGHDGQ
ncbi:MAG TPA: AraC family transcriptional regulator [Devosia sp.]|jgi:AraC family transcriptional regulator|uniref:AraC family transcriptional regulator n=1 Tax=Devosia sp. TaxID=1871048 RepID=UPI002DDCAC1C|nr:AraC family transcriptional regulator [Devosia sp.]HEV2515085.1 AraC family transcriptional regulator [Devosia sp.]